MQIDPGTVSDNDLLEDETNAAEEVAADVTEAQVSVDVGGDGPQG